MAPERQNQIRKIQFAALIERRNDAARRFLQEAAVGRRGSSAEDSVGPEISSPLKAFPVFHPMMVCALFLMSRTTISLCG
jgi:hypothetical protein